MKFDELIKKVAEELGLTNVTTRKVVEAVFDTIKNEAYGNQTKVRVPGFGIFMGKTLPAKSGECKGIKYSVPERKTMKLKVAKDIDKK